MSLVTAAYGKQGIRPRPAQWLVGLNPELLSMVRRSPLGKLLGREGMHFSLELAVEKYLASPK